MKELDSGEIIISRDELKTTLYDMICCWNESKDVKEIEKAKETVEDDERVLLLVFGNMVLNRLFPKLDFYNSIKNFNEEFKEVLIEKAERKVKQALNLR